MDIRDKSRRGFLAKSALGLAGLSLLPSTVFAAEKKGRLDKSLIPSPVMDGDNKLVELYWKAWELAWEKVKYQDGMPQSPYMDEGLWDHTVWIWDTAFMVHFCKYSPKQYPGIESFDNFYTVMHGTNTASLKIHHPDNPPLFAWIENDYARFTGNTDRFKHILTEKKYLQKHYDYFENTKPHTKFKYAGAHTNIKKEEIGFRWWGVQSGMDNTPRGRGVGYGNIYWIDAIAQQGLAALNISRIAETIGDKATAKEYKAKYKVFKDLVNKYYWDEEDGMYYDINVEAPYEKVKVKTPASFWPMLAEMCDKKQAAKLEQAALKHFGGDIPWPTVSADDPDFHESGCYWKGGVWLPTAYMATKALEKYGYHETADKLSLNLVKHMRATYDQFEPHTIWECYNPTKPIPATHGGDNGYSREDFCGWSALGPISMLIENVLGFHDVDAIKKEVRWRLHRSDRHGIKDLRFGDIKTSVIADGDTVEVESDGEYKLYINGKKHKVKKGKQTFKIRRQV
ncbi:glycoside hydrolase [Fulvitalea axinellae]|uniref:Glycoside hydrolase n=1 Tax=Fulvitalea axinellae TaxID=1182444 RepID=A0AAU9CMU8_9BACT|nr:glycoside hydrolase [Fulvitalea axinellae]